MAFAYITEYNRPTVPGISDTFEGTLVKEQVVAIGATSVQSAAFQNSTNVIKVHADAPISYQIGMNPTAVAATGTSASAAGTQRISANVDVFKTVPKGAKIAIIASA